MKWWAKLILILTILIFLSGIAFGIYCVVARTRTNQYNAQLRVCFLAAGLSDDFCVQTETGDVPLDDESYRKLKYYLTRDCTLPLFPLTGTHETISLRIGEDTLLVRKKDDHEAVVDFSTGGQAFYIGIRADDLWKSLVLYTGQEHYLTEKTAETKKGGYPHV